MCFDSSHPNGVKWYLIKVLIWISPMADDIEHLHERVDYLNISYTEMSVQDLCTFLHRIACLLEVEFFMYSVRELYESSLYILGNRPLAEVWFVNIFTLSVGCLLTVLIMFFDEKVF